MKRGLLLAGLGPHEAAAMGIMLRIQWRDMEIVDLGRSADFELPQQGLVARACEGVVVDLHGVGLRRRTPQTRPGSRTSSASVRASRSSGAMAAAGATAAPMIRCRGSCNGSTDPLPARP